MRQCSTFCIAKTSSKCPIFSYKPPTLTALYNHILALNYFNIAQPTRSPGSVCCTHIIAVACSTFLIRRCAIAPGHNSRRSRKYGTLVQHCMLCTRKLYGAASLPQPLQLIIYHY